MYGSGDATADIVAGPSTPPLGIGSAHFNTGSDGFQSAQLRNSGWAGTRIDALTSLGYSTYAAQWNGQQVPYLTIYLDWDNNGSRDDRLWFEPDYTSPAAINTWQTWDALNGQWYSDVEFGPGSNTDTLSAYLLLHPDATIINDGMLGGIRIASGFASSGDVFDANVDAFTIGTAAATTTYDFEPASSSVPDGGQSWVLLSIGVVALAGLRANSGRR